ncbi:hypothetical protein Strvi_6003 [Streptomyces violaceusniger Tu 4113]|uniref:Uncharacterized protein n=1 Tax=Streptomyces violaceusniger (strain Tu 4113) TaxID=653045 RepID=G2PGC4_STRV4|nr:hypothetical protein Strvi_6003 [Streptomyces violaceusniger Tu 4113]
MPIRPVVRPRAPRCTVRRRPRGRARAAGRRTPATTVPPGRGPRRSRSARRSCQDDIGEVAARGGPAGGERREGHHRQDAPHGEPGDGTRVAGEAGAGDEARVVGDGVDPGRKPARVLVHEVDRGQLARRVRGAATGRTARPGEGARIGEDVGGLPARAGHHAQVVLEVAEVGVADGDHDPGGSGEVVLEQPDEEVVGEHVDGEGGLDPLGGLGQRVGVLHARVAHEPAQRWQITALRPVTDLDGGGADTPQRGEVRRDVRDRVPAHGEFLGEPGAGGRTGHEDEVRMGRPAHGHLHGGDRKQRRGQARPPSRHRRPHHRSAPVTRAFVAVRVQRPQAVSG